jgi:hypothetical protein
MEEKKKRNRYTFEMLSEAIPRHTSWNSLVRDLKGGTSGGGNSQGHFKNLATRWGIDFSHFTGKSWAKGTASPRKLSPQEALTNYGGTDRLHAPGARVLRRCMVDIGVPLQCASCAIGPEWNGMRLQLQVDHIDGDRFNCTKENLRFMCPNCHSQTHNWGIKNASFYVEDSKTCVDCGKPRVRNAVRCRPCSLKTGIFSEENKRHRPKKIAWPDLATLQAMVTEMPMLEIGRRLGVSDNAVRKHMRKEMKKV